MVTVPSFLKFKTDSKNLLLLSFSSAVLLGLSFPPFPLGIFACIGFVPYLFVAERIQSFSRFFRYTYFTFFIFTIITLYWVGGFTHLRDPYLMFAGALLYFSQPLLLSLPALLYYFVRKKISTQYTVGAFPFIWITYEWLFAYGEFAFPWLTLGNSQTYNLSKIQFIELTGVYGLSFWLLTINVLIFLLAKAQMDEFSIKTRNILLAIILFFYIAPNFYNVGIDRKKIHSDKNALTIGIVQPNIDPWEKWEGEDSFSSRWNQAQYYLQLIQNNLNKNIDIVVLPESAILLNLPQFHKEYSIVKKIIDSLNISLLSGYVKVKYYYDNSAPVSSSVIKGTNIRYDSFNSILFLEPKNEFLQSYDKMRLVPFAERIPYAESVHFLIEPLRWGVGISNWARGKDSTIFYSTKFNSKFLAMVCYESIFPEFVSQFVNNGAEFIVFITNDSWWGNTSGARQHQQFAALRAIENRRWIVRCANGGISTFIDPYGNAYNKTEMYKQDFISQTIVPQKEKTFYTLHGDWLARICAIITLIIIVISIGYLIIKK